MIFPARGRCGGANLALTPRRPSAWLTRWRELGAATSARSSRPLVNDDELSRLKHELLQAEVRMAKARATMAGAADIKVLNTRLKALTK